MIKKFKDFVPVVPDSCYVFDSATVIGNVTLGERCILYPGAVVRGEKEKVVIGNGTNIQENSCIHIESGFDVIIGSNVTIGHNCIIHACTISDDCLIGMGAIVQDGAVIGKNCFIGAGALIPRNMVVPDGHMVYGFPARIIRPIKQEEYDEIRISAAEYMSYLDEFKRQENNTLQ
ncbi:MAG: gamma carbonic anhydrase family protein [Epulopiscium sp.]|nr:gamma carbonic anhydrase family protein [Candidatus Epulonipiscium sp.]